MTLYISVDQLLPPKMFSAYLGFPDVVIRVCFEFSFSWRRRLWELFVGMDL